MLTLSSNHGPSPSNRHFNKSQALQTARRFVEVYQEGDFEALLFLVTSKCVVKYADQKEVVMEAYIEDYCNLSMSFPDLRFSFQAIKTTTTPGEAVIEGFSMSGTHTGQPYSCGPHPAIDAKGIKVKSDPENIIMHINYDGFIEHIEIRPQGSKAGPAGLYEQVGGLIS